MIVDVEVPNQGLTITEATLVEWRRHAGDKVEKGEVLFEIETDKAVQEIESPASGTLLAVLAAAGDVVPLGQIVARIGTEAGDRVELPPPAADVVERKSGMTIAAGEGAAGRRGPDAILISPRARRAAAQFGVDLTTVVPTGGRGRHIRETDVVQAYNRMQASSRPQSAAENRRVGACPPPPPDTASVPNVGLPPPPDTASVPNVGLPPLPNTAAAPNTGRTTSQTVPAASGNAIGGDGVPTQPLVVPPAIHAALGRFRAATARRTAASFRDVPHIYLTRELLADRLVALRAEIADDLEKQSGTRISFTDFLLKALALSLRAFPSINSQWSEVAIVPLTTVDIGLAVNTPQGLVAPILREVETRSLLSIARERVSLAEAARAGRLRPDQMAGGSFTLSNLGASGVDQFDAIIVPPQSGILAAGSIKKRPFIVDDQLQACHTLILTLSLDHRVVDGAEAARFFDHLATLLEKPALLCAQ